MAATESTARKHNGYGKLILVRHGYSDFNQDNRFTGWTDVALSTTGLQEAEEVGKIIRDIPFDRAYTSALSRAQITLDILLQVAGQAHIPVEKDAALNERNYGSLNGLNKKEASTRFGAHTVEEWRRGYYTVPPEGESLHMTGLRCIPYLVDHILPSVKMGENVVISSHGNTLRCIVMHLLGLTPDLAQQVEIGWCEPIIFEIDTDGSVQRLTCIS
eukprot:Ihof_evm11s149 gene=Ihof_evmTU11s149